MRNSEINVSAKHIIDINAMKQLCSLRPTLVKIFYLLLFLFLRMMSLSFTLFLFLRIISLPLALFLFMRMISLSLAIFHVHQFLFIFVVCSCVLPFSAVCLSFHILIFLCTNVSIFECTILFIFYLGILTRFCLLMGVCILCVVYLNQHFTLSIFRGNYIFYYLVP